nr:MAG: polyprotein [Wufeng shrew iflavirus 8]
MFQFLESEYGSVRPSTIVSRRRLLYQQSSNHPKRFGGYEEANVPNTQMDQEQPDAISRYNELCNRLNVLRTDETYTCKIKNRCREWTVRRRLRWTTSDNSVREISANAIGHTLRDAKMTSAVYLIDRFESWKESQELHSSRITQNVISYQMDEVKENEQGVPTQDSDKQENTIITNDQEGSKTSFVHIVDVTRELSSSEKFKMFEAMTNRWMPYKTIDFTTADTMGKELIKIMIPNDLYKNSKCAPNLIPFETYVLSQVSAEIKVLTNASPFNVGKLLLSVMFDCYKGMALHHNVVTALQRPHVILDISARNEGVMDVPFIYRRGYMLNNPTDGKYQNATSAHYAMVTIFVLSPLRVSAGSSNTVNLRIFYRLKDAKFTGQSFRLPVTQMDPIETLLNQVPTKGLKKVLMAAESALDQIGADNNNDKPKLTIANIVIPRTRLNFSSGVGLSDAIPLRSNPHSMTTMLPDNNITSTPQTTLDIAKIWGLFATCVWKSSQTAGQELFSFNVDPTLRSSVSNMTSKFTPIEFVSSLYAFWGGPTEIRFDFVSSANYHNGTVMVSIQYIRPASEICEYESCYTKTFHLGAQKSFSVTTPWISETIYRRNSAGVMKQIFDQGKTTDATQSQTWSVGQCGHIRCSLIVLNPLRFIADASNEIEVLIFWRASETFTCHSLINSTLTINGGKDMDLFPVNYTIPSVQMDSGDKESLDPTLDFGLGNSLNNAVRIDQEHRIKDIMRKPVLIYQDLTVPKMGSNQVLVIPTIPPDNKSFTRTSTNEFIAAMPEMVKSSPQLMLLNLFRYYRGTQQYTLVARGMKAVNMYITFVPRSGVRKFGNIKYIMDDSEKKYGPHGIGYNTDIWSVGVNSTVTYEIPYASETTWLLLNEDDITENYSWHDKVDTFNGHLLINGTGESTIDVWWSGGDDFILSNWYGVPEYSTDAWAYTLWETGKKLILKTTWPVEAKKKDNSIKVKRESPSVLLHSQSKVHFQMDIINDIVNDPLNTLGAMGVGLIPGGSSLLMCGTKRRVDRTLDTVDRAIDNFNLDFHSFVDTLGTNIQTLCNSISNVFTSAVNYGKILFNLLLDLFGYFRTGNAELIGVALVRVLSQLNPKILWNSIVHYGSEIGIWFKKYFAQNHTPSVQMLPDVGSLTGIFVGLLATLLGVRISRSRRDKISNQVDLGFTDDLIYRLTQSSGLSYILAVIRFVEKCFVNLKEIVMRLLGFVSPEAEALSILNGTDNVLHEFIKDAHVVMNEINSSAYVKPNFRLRFWRTVTQAYNVQKLLAQAPKNSVSPVLSKICSDVIRLGNEKLVDINSSPVRWEPMVVCIEGDPGLGKSHCISSVVSKLFGPDMPFNVKNELIFVRTPGNRFWTGYRNQPVILYDDWLNLSSTELITQQLSELYSLKSTAVFIPEMAHLEEKRMKINPLIVILLCNGAYPSASLSTVATYKDAIYRRRDLVVRCESEISGREEIARLPQADKEKYTWLNFKVYESSLDQNGGFGQNMKFDDFVSYMQGYWDSYAREEGKNVKRRMDDLNKQLQLSDVTKELLLDPFENFYNYQEPDIPSNPNWLPQDVVNHDMDLIMKALDEEIKKKIEGNTPEIPEPNDITSPHVQILDECSSMIAAAMDTPWFVHCAAKWTISRIQKICEFFIGTKRSELITCTGCMKQLPGWMECPQKHVFCRSCIRKQWVSAGKSVSSLRCSCHRDLHLYIPNNLRVGIGLLVAQWRKGMIKTEYLLEKMISAFNMSEETIQSFYIVNGALSLLVLILWGWQTSPGLISRWMGIEGARHAYSFSYNPYKDFPEPSYIFVDKDWLPYTSNTIAERTAEELKDLGEDTYYDCQEDFGTTNILWDLSASTWNSIAKHLPLGLPTFQMPDDEGEEQVACGSKSFVALDIVYDEDNAMEHYTGKCMATHMVCLHEELLKNVHIVEYQDHRWIIPKDTGDIVIPDFCSSIECLLIHPHKRKMFFEQWLMFKRKKLYNLAVRVWNSYGDHVEFDNLHPAITPQVLQLMRISKQAFKEADRLVNEPWYIRWTKFDGWEIIAGIIGLATIGTGLYYAINGMYAVFGKGDSCAASQVDDSSYKKRQGSSVKTPPQNKSRVEYTKRDTQAALDGSGISSQFSAARSQVGRNYFSIVCNMGDNKVRVLNGCGIKENIGLIPRHYHRYIQNNLKQKKITSLHLVSCMQEQLKIPYLYNVSDFFDFDLMDLCIFKLPKTYPHFKDITHFIADDSIHDIQPTGDGELLIPPNTSTPFMVAQAVQIFKYLPSMEVNDVDGTAVINGVTIEYNFSQKGACGAILFKPEYHKPILGMHFAGVGEGTLGRGYSVPLNYDALKRFLDTATVEMDDADFVLPLSECKVFFEDNVAVKYIGAVSPDLAVFNTKKTQIIPSEIQRYNSVPTYTAPAILSSSDPRWQYPGESPLRAGCSKHGLITNNFPLDKMKIAKSAMRDIIFSRIDKPIGIPLKPLSVIEAICGFEHLEFYDSINMDTSAGWPWCCNGKESKKEHWIEIIRNENLYPIDAIVHDSVMEKIIEKEKIRKKGIIPITVFVDQLKDERRKFTKLLSLGGTRVFCGSPVDFVIALRQYFLHFFASFMKNRWKLKHSVGINIHGNEWSRLVRNLLARSPFIVTIDYSNFGPAFNGLVANDCFDLMIEWVMNNYEFENEEQKEEIFKMLNCMKMEQINSIHLVVNTLYQQFCGSPSGSAATAIFNTLVNLYLLIMAWICIMSEWCKNNGYALIETFEKLVEVYCYGDDVVMAVDPSIINLFNAVTISEFFKPFGIVSTDAGKSECIQPYTTIHEAKYLGCYFNKHPYFEEWLAGLDKEKIHDIPLWITGKSNKREKTAEAARVAVEWAYGWGIDYFDQFKSELNFYLKKSNIETISIQWDELDAIFYSEYY